MAIFTPGPFIGRISGNIGGINFVQGKYGPFVRKRLQRTKHNSPDQLITRARFQDLLLTWPSLSPQLRQAWNTTAKQLKGHTRVGASYVRTGFNLFMELNLILGNVWIPHRLEPPILQVTPHAKDLSLNASQAGIIQLDWTQPDPGFFFFQYIYGSRSMSSRPKTHFGDWRFLTAVLFGPGARNVDFTLEFDTILGHPYEGEVIAAKMRPFHYARLPGFTVQAQTTTVP